MSAPVILIEASPGEVRGALVRNGAVWDVVHHRVSNPSLIDAVYRARVRRVDAGINGAFVDIGIGPEAFMRARDASVPGERAGRKARIAEQLHEGAQIDVRVVADGFADQGPRVARIARITPDPDPCGPTCRPTVLQSPADRGRPYPRAARPVSGVTAQMICGDGDDQRTLARAPGSPPADLPEPDGPGFTRGPGGSVRRSTGWRMRNRSRAVAARVRLPGGAETGVRPWPRRMCVIDINSAAGAVNKGPAARRAM